MLSLALGGGDLKSLEEKLASLGKAVETTAILDEAGAFLLNRITSRFLAQTAPDGEKWPISMAALHRAKIGRDGGTLFDTGKLYHSIQLKVENENQRSIGTDVEYARKHQEGLDGMPRRQFLGVSNEDVDILERLLTNRLVEALR